MRNYVIIFLTGAFLVGCVGSPSVFDREPVRPSVVLNENTRRLAIYGAIDEENHARVVFGSGDGSGDPDCPPDPQDVADFENTLGSPNVQNSAFNLRVIVTLRSGSIVSGSCIKRSIPLFDGVWFAANVAPDQAVRRVREIIFIGGNQADFFENLTDIASVGNGGAGDDELIGGDAYDILRGDDGNDTLRGRGGGDLLDGGFGSNNLFGGGGIDELTVKATGNNATNNLLCGGAGDDVLKGSSLAAVNRLNGQGGADTLYGYLDAGTTTTFRFNLNEDTVYVNDNDEPIDPNDPFAPQSELVDCGD
jgi:Ca2+-binding RTX toxin-like protein